MTQPRIGIIGAGMAGLACAQALAAAGHEPRLFDKGRGVGGRLATRRGPDDLRFDHGAQYITARGTSFSDALARLRSDGVVHDWQAGAKPALVGAPSMNAIAKHLAKDRTIELQREAQGITHTPDGWAVSFQDGVEMFDYLVATPPAPQLIDLLGADHDLSDDLSRVAYDPCWTLMAAFPSDAPFPFAVIRDPEADLSWIAHDGAKPGRATLGTWVAHASAAWSRAHLEHDKEEIAARMLALLADRLRVDPDLARHVAAHRWRYAQVTSPLGRPFLQSDDGRLFLGGDWCLAARVEAAWDSGRAIARAISAAVHPNDAVSPA